MKTQEATMREAITVHVHMNKRHWDALRRAGHGDILEDTPENRVLVVHEGTANPEGRDGLGDVEWMLDMTEDTKNEKLIDCKDVVEILIDICKKTGWENTTVNIYLTGPASHAGVFCLELGISLMANVDFRLLHDINFKQWDRDKGEFWTAVDLWDVIQ